VANSQTKIWTDERGTTAVEFGIVAPVFIALVVGMLYMCLSLFVVGSLHYAVEDGARCASVRTSVCSDTGSTIAYARSRYFGPSSPTFTAAAAACGNSVSASLNYVVHLGLTTATIPITASACFP
jgi:Flp pilus assembly protein TadG